MSFRTDNEPLKVLQQSNLSNKITGPTPIERMGIDIWQRMNSLSFPILAHPYRPPLQPFYSVASPFHLLTDDAAVISTGAFVAVARYASATPMPPSVLRCGIGWQYSGPLDKFDMYSNLVLMVNI
ncbi:LOW QUALITY PROTEIN: hypothetical protein M8C21_025419 [Ambrosia artemisiifolia]|uniref:Uncharacterized protein n=1 Tax=Ambrosia artemisiifolia TaxID=4212 RepID=A0AAD5BN16_AMBAR|nr:LOW QUALITY PROTEIN: hypothetical protein M8C21_025419 [Ambrosia artemisiifolia]